MTLTQGGRGTHRRESHLELEEEPGPSDSDCDGTLIEQAMEALRRGAWTSFQYVKPWPSCPCRLLQRQEIKQGMEQWQLLLPRQGGHQEPKSKPQALHHNW